MNKNEKIKYYEIYFKNLSPSTFDVNIENDKIIIDGIDNPYPESFDDTKIKQYSYMKKQTGGNIESEENLLQEAFRIQQTGTMKEKANFLAENPQLFAGKFFAKGGKISKKNVIDLRQGDVIRKYNTIFIVNKSVEQSNRKNEYYILATALLSNDDYYKQYDEYYLTSVNKKGRLGNWDYIGKYERGLTEKEIENKYRPFLTKSKFQKGGEVSKKKKEYVIESKGFNYVRDSIERRKKELEQLKQKLDKLKKGGKVAKTWKQKYNKKYGFDLNESHSLKDISKKTGVSKKGLQAIYNKGVGAWKNNLSSVRVKGSFKKNPNTKKFPRNKRLGKEQWAMARVYSAVMGGKASKVDSKELKMKLGGNILLLFFIACISLNLISCKNWEVVQEIDVNCYHLYNVKTKKVNVLLTKEKLEVGKLYNLKSIEKVDLEDPTIE